MAALGTAALLSLTMCACTQPAPIRPGEFVGETLQTVDARVGVRDEMTQLTQDASPAVGREPVLTGDDLASDQWIVVAACADAEDVNDATVLELAVIPTDTFTASVAQQVSDGEFDETVSCTFDQ